MLRVKLGAALRSVSFTSDGRQLLAVCADQSVRLIDATTGSLLRHVELGRQINTVSLTPDSQFFCGAAMTPPRDSSTADG